MNDNISFYCAFASGVSLNELLLGITDNIACLIENVSIG